MKLPEHAPEVSFQRYYTRRDMAEIAAVLACEAVIYIALPSGWSWHVLTGALIWLLLLAQPPRPSKDSAG